MNFSIGSILLFKKYYFTDSAKCARHFGLVLLPEKATKFQNSILCCVITSKKPKIEIYSLLLSCSTYKCFKYDSYACFDRRDLQSKGDLDDGSQPKGRLNREDLAKAFKKLRKSLYGIRDSKSGLFLVGTIIHEWKKALGLVKI